MNKYTVKYTMRKVLEVQNIYAEDERSAKCEALCFIDDNSYPDDPIWQLHSECIEVESNVDQPDQSEDETYGTMFAYQANDEEANAYPYTKIMISDDGKQFYWKW